MARSDNKRMKAFSKRLNEMRKAPAAAVSKAEEDLASKATKGTTVPEAKATKPGAGMSFKSAFAAARSAGDKTFTWNGKSYTTQIKGEGAAKAAPKVSRAAPKTEAKPAPKTEAKPKAAAAAIRPPASLSLANKGKTAAAPAASSTMKAPASLSLANKGKNVPAKPTFEQKRSARLEEWRKAAEAPGASKYVKDRYKYGKETGMVGNFKKGGPVMESDRKPIDMRRAVLGSDKEIVARGNRTPAEKMPKSGPDAPKRKPLGRAGAAGYKSGGNVMADKGITKKLPTAKQMGSLGMAKGGGVEKRGKTKGKMVKMAKGGSVSSRADGCAKKGRTSTKHVAMRNGGSC